MKSSHCFSFKFDVAKLQRDLNHIKASWIEHFNTAYYEGHWSGLTLRGPVDKTHELAASPDTDQFANTALLDNADYFREVLDFFECPKTSVRLLRLGPGSFIKEHTDPDLAFWNNFVRIHVPIQTNDRVDFMLDNEQLHMLPGECWFGEFAKPHSVANRGRSDRTHLVIDMTVNDWIHQLFVKEKILEEGETEPDPIADFSKEQKMEMVRSLLAMKTESATAMACKICAEQGLDIQSLLSDL